MTVRKITNEYDEIKGFLNKIRKIQEASKQNDYRLISEQMVEEPPVEEPPVEGQPAGNNVNTGGEEQQDIAVINNVDVEIHSEDPEDLELSEDEKKKISQLIDDFYTEVSEMVEFDKLHIYDNSVKLDGKIGDINLQFTLSTGDDTGFYISNTSMLKIDEMSLNLINKLQAFQGKFSNTMNNLLVVRKST